jgi:hypothetical protein
MLSYIFATSQKGVLKSEFISDSESSSELTAEIIPNEPRTGNAV